MPICPDCSQYSPEFSCGRYDPQDSTWYCNMCWTKFDQDEKKERLKLGYMLPEDRVLWYSPSSVLVPPSHPLSESSSWCYEGSLVVEVLDAVEVGKPNPWRLDLTDDFLFSGSTSLLVFGDTLPIVTLRDVVESPHLALDQRHADARKFVKITRQERKLVRSLETRAKARAAAEVEAKKRDLLEIAKRRAQMKKKPGKLQLVKKKIDAWKAENADLLGKSTPLPLRPAVQIFDAFEQAEPPAKRMRVDSPI